MSGTISKVAKSEYLWETKEQAKYHIMVIYDGTDQAYGDKFLRGINKIADDEKVAIELQPVEEYAYGDRVIELLDLASYAQVDGIIVHGINNEKFIAKVKELSADGMPIITLNEDLSTTDRIAYVGVNRYRIGQAAGDILGKSIEGTGKIAVIKKRAQDQLEEPSQDLLILGLEDKLKENQDLSLETVRYTQEGVLSAENVVESIFDVYQDINGIFCTDGENTLGVVQFLLDNNLVNKVSLVGFGDDEEVKQYIQKGNIIEGSLVIDYEEIGKEAVKAFIQYIKTGVVPNYIDTTVEIIEAGS